jgi:pimeloyl-ACP methyl ester carboxylesterase
MQAAIQLPGRVIGLVGVDTYQSLEIDFSPEQIAEATAAFRADFVSAVDGYVRNMFSKNADSALVNWAATDMSAAPPEIAINVVENYLSVNPVDMLKEVSVPIRAINAEKPVTDLENNQKHTASFDVKLMPNVGHFVQLEDPVTFNRLLHETLDELIGNSDN